MNEYLILSCIYYIVRLDNIKSCHRVMSQLTCIILEILKKYNKFSSEPHLDSHKLRKSESVVPHLSLFFVCGTVDFNNPFPLESSTFIFVLS